MPSDDRLWTHAGIDEPDRQVIPIPGAASALLGRCQSWLLLERVIPQEVSDGIPCRARKLNIQSRFSCASALCQLRMESW
jgi:hypothetical protein